MGDIVRMEPTKPQQQSSYFNAAEAILSFNYCSLITVCPDKLQPSIY